MSEVGKMFRTLSIATSLIYLISLIVPTALTLLIHKVVIIKLLDAFVRIGKNLIKGANSFEFSV